MKKKCILLTAGFLGLLSLLGCSKKEERPTSLPTEPKEELAIDYDEIGRLHNVALDAVFQELKAAKGTRTSKAQKLEIAHATILHFFETNPSALCQIDDPKHLAEQEIERVYKNTQIALQTRSNSKDQCSSLPPTESIEQLTDIQISLLTELDSIVNSADKDLSSFRLAIAQLENKAKASCSDKEAPLVLASISVAKHTCEYWAIHYDEWIALGAKTRGLHNFNWKEVGKWDIAGAVGGCLAALITGPYGWGSILKATLAGAVSVSACNAVYQLLS